MEHDAADHLRVVVPLTEGSLRGFAHDRECFREQVVEGLACLESNAERRGHGDEVGVVHALVRGLETRNFFYNRK